MAKKLHSDKVCRSRLSRYVSKFKTDIQDEIGWDGDTWNETTYSWHFEHAGKRFELVCDRHTLEITRISKGVVRKWA